MAKLKISRIHPGPPASRQTLIRRVTYDLIGLPPTPKEIDDFVGDSAANAYEKVVDRFFEDIISEIQLPAKSIVFTVDGLRQTVYGRMPRNVSERSYVGVLRRYFIQKAETLGFPTIDLHKSFDENYRKNGKRFEFPYDAHWNEHGHSIVFNELLQLDWNLCR